MRTEPVLGNQSGLALVLTLMLISLLVTLTLQLMVTVNRQVAVATAQREQVRLDSLALGGLQLARAALAAGSKQADNFDSLFSPWANLDQEAIKTLTGEVDLKITVTDLSGRLQVHALADSGKKKYREIWRRFLLSGRFAVADAEEAEGLLDAIADWVDQDNEERPRGAEEAYYRSLHPPYSCRNGKIPVLSELLLIKGVTPVLLFGDREHEGLAAYITLAGEDGRINLNTAPLPVLQALAPEMTESLAQELIDFRTDPSKRAQLGSSTWYLQVRGLPHSIQLAADILTVNSAFFQVRVESRYQQFSRSGTAVVQRGKNQEQTLLSWKMD